LCLSLANPTVPPDEVINFSGGLEIEWRTFTGGNEVLYWNLAIIRLTIDGTSTDEDAIRLALIRHVHRGLSYISSMVTEDLAYALAVELG
jgi:DNA sulfur modification protein DndE